MAGPLRRAPRPIYLITAVVPKTTTAGSNDSPPLACLLRLTCCRGPNRLIDCGSRPNFWLTRQTFTMTSQFSFASLRCCGLCIVPLFLMTMMAFAQNPNGSLRGEVQDQSGARVSSAQIAVTSADSSLRREATANERGEFRVEGLLPGSYHVAVTGKGFEEAAADVEVVVSFVRDITVTLKPGSGRETVNVQGQSSSITTEPIDTASAIHGGAVSAHDLETIPLAHRSFANVALLVPGTEPVEPSDPTKARITAVSFGGSSGLNVDLSVDGGNNSDDYIGGFLQNFSPDFIQEFAVHTSQEDADTGGTVGGASSPPNTGPTTGTATALFTSARLTSPPVTRSTIRRRSPSSPSRGRITSRPSAAP